MSVRKKDVEQGHAYSLARRWKGRDPTWRRSLSQGAAQRMLSSLRGYQPGAPAAENCIRRMKEEAAVPDRVTPASTSAREKPETFMAVSVSAWMGQSSTASAARGLRREIKIGPRKTKRLHLLTHLSLQPVKHQFSSVQFSRSVVSNSLRPHELHHARPPCPPPTPRVYPSSSPLSL